MKSESLLFLAVMSQSEIAKKGGVEPSQGKGLCLTQRVRFRLLEMKMMKL